MLSLQKGYTASCSVEAMASSTIASPGNELYDVSARAARAAQQSVQELERSAQRLQGRYKNGVRQASSHSNDSLRPPSPGSGSDGGKPGGDKSLMEHLRSRGSLPAGLNNDGTDANGDAAGTRNRSRRPSRGPRRSMGASSCTGNGNATEEESCGETGSERSSAPDSPCVSPRHQTALPRAGEFLSSGRIQAGLVKKRDPTSMPNPFAPTRDDIQSEKRKMREDIQAERRKTKEAERRRSLSTSGKRTRRSSTSPASSDGFDAAAGNNPLVPPDLVKSILSPTKISQDFLSPEVSRTRSPDKWGDLPPHSPPKFDLDDMPETGAPALPVEFPAPAPAADKKPVGSSGRVTSSKSRSSIATSPRPSGGCAGSGRRSRSSSNPSLPAPSLSAAMLTEIISGGPPASRDANTGVASASLDQPTASPEIANTSPNNDTSAELFSTAPLCSMNTAAVDTSTAPALFISTAVELCTSADPAPCSPKDDQAVSSISAVGSERPAVPCDTELQEEIALPDVKHMSIQELLTYAREPRGRQAKLRSACKAAVAAADSVEKLELQLTRAHDKLRETCVHVHETMKTVSGVKDSLIEGMEEPKLAMESADNTDEPGANNALAMTCVNDAAKGKGKGKSRGKGEGKDKDKGKGKSKAKGKGKDNDNTKSREEVKEKDTEDSIDTVRGEKGGKNKGGRGRSRSGDRGNNEEIYSQDRATTTRGRSTVSRSALAQEPAPMTPTGSEMPPSPAKSEYVNGEKRFRRRSKSPADDRAFPLPMQPQKAAEQQMPRSRPSSVPAAPPGNQQAAECTTPAAKRRRRSSKSPGDAPVNRLEPTSFATLGRANSVCNMVKDAPLRVPRSKAASQATTNQKQPGAEDKVISNGTALEDQTSANTVPNAKAKAKAKAKGKAKAKAKAKVEVAQDQETAAHDETFKHNVSGPPTSSQNAQGQKAAPKARSGAAAAKRARIEDAVEAATANSDVKKCPEAATGRSRGGRSKSPAPAAATISDAPAVFESLVEEAAARAMAEAAKPSRGRTTQSRRAQPQADTNTPTPSVPAVQPAPSQSQPTAARSRSRTTAPRVSQAPVPTQSETPSARARSRSGGSVPKKEASIPWAGGARSTPAYLHSSAEWMSSMVPPP